MSVDLNGTNPLVLTSPLNVMYAGSAVRTVTAWVKRSSTGSRQCIFGEVGTGWGFYIAFNTTRPLIYMGSNLYKYFDDPSGYRSDGLWHWWVFVIEGYPASSSAGFRCYVDGVALTLYAAYNGSATCSTIGSIGYGGYGNLIAEIDEVVVYDVVLSQNEITALYKPKLKGQSDQLLASNRMFYTPLDDHKDGVVGDTLSYRELISGNSSAGAGTGNTNRASAALSYRPIRAFAPGRVADTASAGGVHLLQGANMGSTLINSLYAGYM